MSDIALDRIEKSIPASPVKIIELYNKIEFNKLDTHPDYQRKLVWKKQHKYAFVDTILKNYPFPEIYLATSEIDLDAMESREVVVDGQQRLTTIVDYIKGEGDFENQNKVKPFSELSKEEKKDFLSYNVSVRDLKEISEDLIKEIFKRINSTEYSLNVVELNNAQYGDGEIAMYCKQITDLGYYVDETKTDIILEEDLRKKIYHFFESNNVFTPNDKKRMYDFQYQMLLISTILEGSYFGRSVKVDHYLENYNSSFPEYKLITEELIKSIDAVQKLDFPEKSYWFNKANLFTLLVELTKVDTSDIQFWKLETALSELEINFDLYFSTDDEEEIKHISEDERKYFEVARHGSHEKTSREHRGRVIAKLITGSLKNESSDIVEMNTKFLDAQKVAYALLIPTETGLSKSIIDAVTPVRQLLKESGIHNYEEQGFGTDSKVLLQYKYFGETQIEADISLYRSNGRGDYRIWFKGISDVVKPGDVLAISIESDNVILRNLSHIDYSKL